MPAGRTFMARCRDDELRAFVGSGASSLHRCGFGIVCLFAALARAPGADLATGAYATGTGARSARRGSRRRTRRTDRAASAIRR